jgi:hypothetical protein
MTIDSKGSNVCPAHGFSVIVVVMTFCPASASQIEGLHCLVARKQAQVTRVRSRRGIARHLDRDPYGTRRVARFVEHRDVV